MDGCLRARSYIHTTWKHACRGVCRHIDLCTQASTHAYMHGLHRRANMFMFDCICMDVCPHGCRHARKKEVMSGDPSMYLSRNPWVAAWISVSPTDACVHVYARVLKHTYVYVWLIHLHTWADHPSSMKPCHPHCACWVQSQVRQHKQRLADYKGTYLIEKCCEIIQIYL